jgi:hypothetical protein
MADVYGRNAAIYETSAKINTSDQVGDLVEGYLKRRAAPVVDQSTTNRDMRPLTAHMQKRKGV